MTEHHATRPADTDCDSVRAQRRAAMTDAERKVYDDAYREAGWAMDLAELVYVTRTEAGFTQAELAAAMGTSQSAIAAWENGARTPGVEALERLARACGQHLTHHHADRVTRSRTSPTPRRQRRTVVDQPLGVARVR